MSLQDQITQKKIDISTLETDLSKLEAELALATPHLSILSEIESFADRLEQSARDDFSALIAKAKGLF